MFDPQQRSTLTPEGEVGKSFVTGHCPGVAVGLHSMLVFQREEHADFVFLASPAIAGEHNAHVVATSPLA